jgi:mono/diheme cytochrome c family protein
VAGPGGFAGPRPDCAMRKCALGLGMAATVLTGGLLTAVVLAQSPPPAPAGGTPANGPAPPVEFTKEFLGDPKNVQRGRVVWQARCQFCHGKMAYPGKAPKLDPPRYTPDFVYDRVANGFQGMPPWRHEYSVDELKSVVAYVLSREFPN